MMKPILVMALALGAACGRSEEPTTKQSPTRAPPHQRATLPAELKHFLETADRVELLSIDPSRSATGSKRIDEWVVLGKTDVTEAKVRAELIAALEGGLYHDAPLAACFNPRHAIVATKAASSAKLVICFECHSIRASIDGASLGLAQVVEEPQPTFDRILSAAGVELAPK